VNCIPAVGAQERGNAWRQSLIQQQAPHATRFSVRTSSSTVAAA